jgi:cyclase
VTGTLAAPRLVEVADRVYAYEQPPGGWCVSNAGLLADDSGVVVIDTAATEGRARRLRAEVDGLGAGSRRLLVNTHAHGDHTFGNHLFGPAATIIAHDQARIDMESTSTALTRLWPDVDWGDVRVTLPSVTVSDRLVVRSGGRSAELIHLVTGHTGGDLVAWLPDERVLFAGDVLMSGVTPFALFGSVRGTLAAIEQIRALQPAVIVCGHGPVAGPDVLDACARYLGWIGRLAGEARAAGLTPLAAAREADLGEFAGLLDPERIVANLHRAYADADDASPGQPLDVARVFGEMVDYNGGQLPACLA